MTQRTFQMPLFGQDGVPAAEEINRWLENNPCCELAELHTAQCECGAPLLSGVVRVMDDFEGLLPGEDELDCDEDDCGSCPGRYACDAFDDEQDYGDVNTPVRSFGHRYAGNADSVPDRGCVSRHQRRDMR